MDNNQKVMEVFSFKDTLGSLKYPEDDKFQILKRKIKFFIGSQCDNNSFYINELDNISVCMDYFQEINPSSWESGIAILDDFLDSLLDFLAQTTNADKPIKQEASPNRQNVFIVHGRDEGMKEAVARLVENQGLDPIILHEKPDTSLTIIEKLEKYIENCSFAIVVISPEDVGSLKVDADKDLKNRARQNVIFELGWLIGFLGRKNVLLLYKETPNFEFPSDLQGVLYKKFNSIDWKYEVIKEMKNAGWKVTLERIKG